jgi:D-aminoacyl-tRNA deacylase
MEFYTVICSTLDKASANVANRLINKYNFTMDNNSSFKSKNYPNMLLHITNKPLLYADELDEIYPDTGCFIFVSQHKSASNIPTLTCHTTGNFNENTYGGKVREIGICSPWVLKQYLLELNGERNNVPQYDITLEASHHGPTSLMKPTLFVEIGSTEREWSDEVAAETICRALLKVIYHKPRKCEKVAIAFGGNHYPSKFNRILLDSEFGLASIVAKHNLRHIDKMMIYQLKSKSTEPVSFAIYDSKGMGVEKKRILLLLEDSGLEIIKV